MNAKSNKIMKLSRIFFISVLSALALAFTGCKDAEAPYSDAILVNDSSLLLPAAENDKVITIYADGNWIADVTDTWLTIEPKYGNGTQEVKIHADYNSAETSRNASIIVKGSDIVGNVTIDVTQKGDRFKNASTYSVSELVALEEGTLVKVSECQVMAMSTKGLVVSDGTSSIYVSGTDNTLKIGDKITLTGDMTLVNDIPAVALEDATLVSAGEAAYPDATNITETMATYAPGVVEYVTFDGSYAGGKFTANDSESGAASNPISELKIGECEMHYVTVNGYYIGTADKKCQFVVTSITDNGPMGTVYLGFDIENSDFANANKTSFPTTYQFAAAEGDGYCKYVPYDLENTNGNAKFAMDISGNDPRCTGPWPEDYWLFYGEKPIKSGSKVQIKLGARTSATGHKYWILEYLDGKTWKTAGEPKLSEDLPGEQVYYTAAMNADGSTNVTVNETVVFSRNVEHGQFRFRCVANWQANGSGALAARNGGSARLAVKNACQPTIIVLEEGDGSAVDPVPANITVNVDHISFDGTPADPKTFTVLSDQDFKVSSNVSWLTIDEAEGTANEEKTFTVTCAPSELASLREGTITILAGETEYTIPVIQGALGQKLDPFISVSTGNTVKAGADETTITVKVQSNVSFTQSSDSDWITFEAVPETKAQVEWTEVKVKVAANTVESERTGRIVFANEENNLESVVTITQEAYIPPTTGEIFADDFSWMRPYIDAYNATQTAAKAVGKSVEDNNASGVAPNLYTTAGLADLAAALVAKGYEDLNPSPKVVYPQDCYWKFGKTSAHTGIRLPAFNYEGDAVISFDWSPHMTGSGTIDLVNIVVEIEGTGKVVTASGLASVSDPTVNDWTKGKLGWKNVSFTLKGLSKTDRVLIRPQYMSDHDGVTQMRWYVDNIVVKEPEPVLHAEWAFSAEDSKSVQDNFGGTAGVVDRTAGDGGMYFAANNTSATVGSGKIKYVQVDKTAFTDATPKRIVGATGQPYVTGAWPGDYWLFEATDGNEYAAGTKVHIYFTTRLSATGQMYWTLEAWDGEKWVPTQEMKTATVDGKEVSYNFTPAKATPDSVVDYTWTLAKACTTMQFRYTCMANWQANGKGALAAPNGGTCRIAGASATDTAASTSPIFEVVQ